MDVNEIWREWSIDDLQIWNMAFIIYKVRGMTWYNRIYSMHVLVIDNNLVCVCETETDRER